ncbi:hypothetical protein [Ferrimonas balearica]|uniref:hypothetical protein n=1 Tax=Ferrimonas balearica TaxID=44012 RepID=UPI001C997BEC|nr:hypothetical protein [Ferrimonas balearica]MBY5920265.1 hypothetical protein [Ferrimonas balearica]MBY5997050.1 hypothetical protein [Ferrimonas balearica]
MLNTQNLHTHRLFYGGGFNQVQVHDNSQLATEVLSQFELTGSEHDVVWRSWLGDDRIVALDERGNLYIWPFQSGVKVAVAPLLKLGLMPFKDVSLQGSTLWLMARRQGERFSEVRLFRIDLDSLQVTEYPPCEFDFVGGSMVALESGDFVFYQHSGKPGYKFRTHGLVRYAPQSGQTTPVSLTGKPAPETISVRETFFFHQRHGLALTANAESLRAVQSADGQTAYQFELQLIDFHRQQVRWSRPVRTLLPNQIADEYDCDELVEALDAIAGGDHSASHNDALQSFIECLTCVYLSDDGEQIWLAWQDGYVQCLSSQGELLSPLYQLQRVAPNGERASLSHWHDQLTILDVKNEGQEPANSILTLAIGDPEWATLWQVVLPTAAPVPLCEAAESKPVLCQRTHFDLQLPAPLMGTPMTSGQVDIPCGDLEEQGDRLASLERLNALMPAWQTYFERNIQAGHLFFAFVATQPGGDKVQSEKHFFPAVAAGSDEGRELLAELIEQFTRWPCASRLMGQAGAPVLADAVLSLIDRVEYLPVLARYFCAIGQQESALRYHLNRTLPAIREIHAGTSELTAFNQQLPPPWNNLDHTVVSTCDYDDEY